MVTAGHGSNKTEKVSWRLMTKVFCPLGNRWAVFVDTGSKWWETQNHFYPTSTSLLENRIGHCNTSVSYVLQRHCHLPFRKWSLLPPVLKDRGVELDVWNAAEDWLPRPGEKEMGFHVVSLLSPSLLLSLCFLPLHLLTSLSPCPFLLLSPLLFNLPLEPRPMLWDWGSRRNTGLWSK